MKNITWQDGIFIGCCVAVIVVIGLVVFGCYDFLSDPTDQ